MSYIFPPPPLASRTPRRGLVLGTVLLGALAWTGCPPKKVAPEPCQPQCTGLTCGDDGCGGTCACAGENLCNANGECVPPTSCTDTCQGLGFQCGTVCGQSCGTCSGNAQCQNGHCVCTPQCDGTRCGGDGCGGSCVCPPDKDCNGELQCVDPVTCTDTCVGLGWECGEVCGQPCGNCEDNETCRAGHCACVPNCPTGSCADDGCGTACLCNPGKVCDANLQCTTSQARCDCAPGLVCNARNQCVPPDQCLDRCADFNRVCGELCGVLCGTCAPGSVCQGGACACTPRCDGTWCGPDGCGGLCACGEGTVCNPAFQCTSPGLCTATCPAAEWNCGDLCGTACGTCAGTDVCHLGTCGCAPPCGDVPNGTSCLECSLRLVSLSRVVEGGRLRSVVLGVDYDPRRHEVRPRMADLRLASNRAVQVTAAVAGPALTTAAKSLYVDPLTGNAWRSRADGSFQFLVVSTSNTNEMGTGRVVTVTLSLDEPTSAAFSLVRREQTLAPPAADEAILPTPYDRSVVVTP